MEKHFRQTHIVWALVTDRSFYQETFCFKLFKSSKSRCIQLLDMPGSATSAVFAIAEVLLFPSSVQPITCPWIDRTLNFVSGLFHQTSDSMPCLELANLLLWIELCPWHQVWCQVSWGCLPASALASWHMASGAPPSRSYRFLDNGKISWGRIASFLLTNVFFFILGRNRVEFELSPIQKDFLVHGAHFCSVPQYRWHFLLDVCA